MSKIKELVLEEQERQAYIEKYYSAMYRSAEYMGLQEVFEKLHQSNINYKPKKKTKIMTKETQNEMLKRLFIENNLVKEDVFKHKFYNIITRQGIDKIMAANNIEIQYEIVNLSEDHTHCLIKALGKKGDKVIQTFGECTPNNNSNAYPVAMAEKRAKSRIVLQLAGFYELGVFGEVESEDFKRPKN
jgi:hypothetical protein